MGGLQRFFIRITPIIMLICFICFGISHIFTSDNQQNITYLTHEKVVINDNGTPQEPADDITIENYSYDFQGYIQNANASKLKKSITNSIEIESWQNLIDTFNIIWSNGYDPADITYTLLNGILLVVDGFITGINLMILPFKLTAGILLTALAIMGIKTNNVGVVTTTLNGFIDYVNIPLIPPALPSGSPIYNNTTWLLGDNVYIQNPNTPVLTAEFNFTTQGGGNYKKITIYPVMPPATYRVVYTDTSNNEIEVYRTNLGWIYNDSKTITITNDNQLDDNKIAEISSILNALQATQVI